MAKFNNPVQNARLLAYPGGQIYQKFGMNKALYLKAINSAGHNGIDIVGKQGTPLLASEGEIVEVKNTPEGYGKHIRILTSPDSNGDFYELVYGHCDTISVKIEDKVSTGQVIGGMGNTGFIISGNTPYWGTAPAGKGVHLHFGVAECSTKPTNWQVQYSSGRKVYRKNYDNGFHGYLNPMYHLDLPEDYATYVLGILESFRKKIEEIAFKIKK